MNHKLVLMILFLSLLLFGCGKGNVIYINGFPTEDCPGLTEFMHNYFSCSNTLVKKVEWSGVYDLIIYYEELKSKVDSVEMEFANAVRYYRSPLRQSLTDMRINSMKNVIGELSGFKIVSVYIHGIESDGEDFLVAVQKQRR